MDVKRTSLLGAQACKDLRLIQRIFMNMIDSSRLADAIQLLQSEYPDVFCGMSTLPYKYKILIKDDA
ncbi:hypothetical protein scyTo_0026373, partial [Scyliorhinus torazame]|nr:hypothetical protein [Scyliorhinus torazame]